VPIREVPALGADVSIAQTTQNYECLYDACSGCSPAHVVFDFAVVGRAGGTLIVTGQFAIDGDVFDCYCSAIPFHRRMASITWPSSAMTTRHHLQLAVLILFFIELDRSVRSPALAMLRSSKAGALSGLHDTSGVAQVREQAATF